MYFKSTYSTFSVWQGFFDFLPEAETETHGFRQWKHIHTHAHSLHTYTCTVVIFVATRVRCAHRYSGYGSIIAYTRSSGNNATIFMSHIFSRPTYRSVCIIRDGISIGRCTCVPVIAPQRVCSVVKYNTTHSRQRSGWKFVFLTL